MPVEWFEREQLDEVIKTRIIPTGVVLDIGCGVRPQTFFRPRLHICCEPHGEYVEHLKTHFANTPAVLVMHSLGQDVLDRLPDKSVDSIFLIDVIEHIDKEAGKTLIAACERVARQQIVLFTPLGFMPQDYDEGEQDGWGFHGGEWQMHRSGWTPEDFDASWDILACEKYHLVNGKGQPFNPPFGAFWIIKNFRSFMTPPVRFAVISHTLPPSDEPFAHVLRDVLEAFAPFSYTLITRRDLSYYTQKRFAAGAALAADYRLLNLPASSRANSGRLARLLHNLAKFRQQTRQMAAILKQDGCACAVACVDTFYDLVSAYLASRRAGIPLAVFFMEAYSPQRSFLTKWLETLILRAARRLIFLNAAAAQPFTSPFRRRISVLPVQVQPAGETELAQARAAFIEIIGSCAPART